MKLEHPKLVDLLRKAYSAEKAASFAYIGHAGSLSNEQERMRVREIELDEWEHRANVLEIMRQYDIPISRWYEFNYHIIGKCIGWSCYAIGRFMPYFFAGRLESGNVCEYFFMMRYFRSLGVHKHDRVLFEMGIKEKEHEVYFLDVIRDEPWLPWFERIFSWGVDRSANDVDLSELYPVDEGSRYCPGYKSEDQRTGASEIIQGREPN